MSELNKNKRLANHLNSPLGIYSMLVTVASKSSLRLPYGNALYIFTSFPDHEVKWATLYNLEVSDSFE